MGTNPIAIAIPAGKEAPVVLDIATSVSSFGNIRQHLARGEPLQEGWVVHSKTGEPITDPKKVGEGVLLPIGGHKGSGLALMIGLLAGVLNGAAFGRDVVDPSAPGNAADQHRAVRHRARRVALHRAGCFRRRDGPASQGPCFVADLAWIRFDPAAGRGSPQAPRRPQRQRRATAGGADQAARRSGGGSEDFSRSPGARASLNNIQLACRVPFVPAEAGTWALLQKSGPCFRRNERACSTPNSYSAVPRYLLFPSTQARTCGSTSGSSASTSARVMPGRMRRS